MASKLFSIVKKICLDFSRDLFFIYFKFTRNVKLFRFFLIYLKIYNYNKAEKYQKRNAKNKCLFDDFKHKKSF